MSINRRVRLGCGLRTCLVGKHPVELEPARNVCLATAIWTDGALASADGCRVLLDVAVVGLLVPLHPRRDSE